MRITFIGSSHGVPEAHRKCQCIMIQSGENCYFVDMGTSPMDTLVEKHIPPEKVKAAFFTHMHGDHIDGLLNFTDLATWHFKKCDPQIFLPVKEAAECIKRLLVIAGETVREEIVFKEIEPGLIYDDGRLRVSAIPTQHCYKSYAFALEAEGKKIVITGDLGHPDRDFPQILKEQKTDLLICEDAHFPATDYLPHLDGCEIGKLCITHYSLKRIPSIIEFRALYTAAPVEMANDGMEIEL